VNDDTAGPGQGAIRLEIEPPLAWVILDRPSIGNPLDDDLVLGLQETWATLDLISDVRAIGVASSGSRFSIGFPVGYPHEGIVFGPKSCGCWRPILVELGGDVDVGIAQILGQADAITAVPECRLTVPVNPAERVNAQHLRPRLPNGEIGRLALLGGVEPLTAQRAHQLGLIDELVPAEMLRSRSTQRLLALAGPV
jgi:enoyl-CoA hydratase/carnithine racemase